MTYFWLGFLVAASFAFGAFQRWRRVTDKAVALASEKQAKSLEEATLSHSESARQYAMAAEYAKVSMDLLNSAIGQSVLIAQRHSESATSAMDTADSVTTALKDIVELWKLKAARDRETAMLEREMSEAKRTSENAAMTVTMEVLSEATMAANASAKAASNAAAAVVEAAELYCEQLNVPRRSDAAQRRRWGAWNAAVASGKDPIKALEEVG